MPGSNAARILPVSGSILFSHCPLDPAPEERGSRGHSSSKIGHSDFHRNLGALGGNRHLFFILGGNRVLIVQKYGGNVAVESEVQRGTRFTVSLPLAATAKVESEAKVS